MPVVRMLIAVLLASLVAGPVAAGQAAFEVSELAGYRLTPAVFEQFEAASRLIAQAMRDDPRFADAPLFTREVALDDDVAAAALALDTRLTVDTALRAALSTARISSREYAKFAIALIAAHLAHEFLAAGALRAVPPGVAADNVSFVAAHRPAVSAALESIGVTD
jgi:hypothetical protein